MNQKQNKKVGKLFIQTGAAVTDKYEKLAKSVAAKYGLTVCEIDILTCLYGGHKPHTVRYVSHNTHYSKGMISRCVDSLNKNGYVTVVRDEIDRRAVRISLTEKANPACRALTSQVRAFSATLTAGLSETETEELERILAMVSENIDEL